MLGLWANGSSTSIAFLKSADDPVAAKCMAVVILASEAAGEILFENFRLKLPQDLFINAGI